MVFLLYFCQSLSTGHEKEVSVEMANIRSCDLCPKTFASRSGLYFHNLTHTGDKRHKCDQCNKSFTKRHRWKEHVLTHIGEKLQKCTQCDYSSNCAANLRRHMKKHAGEKSFQCNQCNYSSIGLARMKQHKSLTGVQCVNILVLKYRIEECT